MYKHIFLLAFVAVCARAVGGEASETCSSDSGEKAAIPSEPAKHQYKPSQAALVQFLKLHEPEDPNWTTSNAHLEVTDGCPLNNMYRSFKLWIRDDARAFPGLKVKYVPGMDPVIQFHEGADHPDEYLGVARIDVSEMTIEEVEALLEKRGIRKDTELASQIRAEKEEREKKFAAEQAEKKLGAEDTEKR